jgi:hypothetical protein
MPDIAEISSPFIEEIVNQFQLSHPNSTEPSQVVIKSASLDRDQVSSIRY